MKYLLAFLTLMLCLTARADLAEVKRLMDEPVVLSSAIPRGADTDKFASEIARLEVITGKTKIYHGFKATPREVFSWMSDTSRSSNDSRLLAALVKVNAKAIRDAVAPTLKKDAPAAAMDLEQALKLVESSKTLDRAAQDRFVRLAKIAP